MPDLPAGVKTSCDFLKEVQIKLKAPVSLGASVETIVVRCLPAHGGPEITEELVEGLQTVVRDTRDHRFHAWGAVLVCSSPEMWNLPKMGYYYVFLFWFIKQEIFGNI